MASLCMMRCMITFLLVACGTVNLGVTQSTGEFIRNYEATLDVCHARAVMTLAG